MSRNFELLERAQQDIDLFRVPSITRVIPENGKARRGKVRLPDPDAFTREEILRLVHFLFTGKPNGNGQSHSREVVFCGIDSSEGSSLLCKQVARTLAEQVQSQVCLVDADLRSQPSGRLFDLLESDRSPQWKHSRTKETCRQVTDNLWLADRDTFGQNGGASPLDQLRVLTNDLRDEFGYVVVNAPPVGLYSDAVLLGQCADGVVLVLEANSTRRVTARKAKLALEAGTVRVLGTVLNNRAFPIPERLYRIL